ncbi:MAG: STAS domain-containing protein [Actinomycetota bacterium]|nr:STAS domain-containing protein [Actinomycetota bacterium]
MRGEVDRQSSDVLRRLLLDVVEGQGNLSVALDLSEMTFIDSSGLSMFLEMHGRAVERGGSFVLQNPRPSASRMFEIVGLNRILEIA